MIITDFSQSFDGIDISDEFIPDHTMEALDHYFIKGFTPGGFLTALIAEDYKLALRNADFANRRRFWNIASWLITFAPKKSIGSYEILYDWIADKDGVRSAHVVQAEKDYEWKILSTKVET